MRAFTLAIAAVLTACSNAGTNAVSTGGSAGTQDSAVEAAVEASTESGTDAAGDGGCDPLTQNQTASCIDCSTKAAAAGCAATAKACADDTECAAIATCNKACTDSTCQAKCIAQHEAGTVKLFTYVGCLDAACHDECYCAGCRFGRQLCNPCLTSKCTAECSGCDKNADCIALAYCLSLRCTDSNDTVCQETCVTDFDAGLDPYNVLGTCGMNVCTTECGF
jgi:hypothetical protein